MKTVKRTKKWAIEFWEQFYMGKFTLEFKVKHKEEKTTCIVHGFSSEGYAKIYFDQNYKHPTVIDHKIRPTTKRDFLKKIKEDGFVVNIKSKELPS